MKKNNFKKIVILALSLALLIGAALGVSALAEENGEKLSIISQNVSYEGKTHLYYAVHYENVTNPDAITLTVSYKLDNGETATETVNASEEVTLTDSLGTSYVCRAFRTPGVDAKNFTTEFTVTASTENGTVSAEKTYSVAEYCHEWISYVASVVEPTAKQLKIAAACEATVNYGASVQALLDYYPSGNEADTPDNYSYIRVTDGVADNKYVMNGETVTLSYTGTAPTGKEFSHWVLTYTNGTGKEISGNSFVADGNAILTPAFKGLYSEGFTPGAGLYYSDETKLGNRFDYETKSDSGAYSNNGAITATVVDGARKLEITDMTQSDMLRFLAGNTSVEGANVAIFETDIMLSGAWTGKPTFRIRVLGCDMSLTTDCWNGNALYVPKSGAELKVNLWYNLRLEVYKTESATSFNVKVYLNGDYVTTTTISGSTSSSADMLFTIPKNAATNGTAIYFDNVFYGYAVKDYVAE